MLLLAADWPTVIGLLTAFVGLLGACTAVFQTVRSALTPTAPDDDDVNEHLIDELVEARVQLALAQRQQGSGA